MEEESSCEEMDFLESEDELEFPLYNNNLTELDIPEDEYSDTETDSNDSDVSVHQCQKVNSIEFGNNENVNTSMEEDDFISITENEYKTLKINFSIGSKETGPQIPSNIVEPIQFFKLFFTDQLVNEIIIEINNYAKSTLSSKNLTKNSIWQTWHNVNKDEFWAFIGVILNMGLMPVSDMKEYWSTDPVGRIPFFSNVFTRNRFNQIFWMLHIKTDLKSNDPELRTSQFNGFLEYLDSKFSEHFIPSKNICIGESIVKSNGNISFITYSPIKPTEQDIRIYTMVDSKTGYIYTILPYYGSIRPHNLIRQDLPISTRIPLHMYQTLLDKIPEAQGYHMFTDKYYTSIPLAEELIKMKCHLTGIIKTSRKNIQTLMKKSKFSDKKICIYKKGKIMFLVWKKKRIISLLSTWNDALLTDIKKIPQGGVEKTFESRSRKPNVLVSYASSMSGIDKTNRYTSIYCFLRKQKWWRKIFFWGLEVSVINSYIIYKAEKTKRNEKPLTHLRYMKLLVDQLVNNFRQERPKASTSSSEIRLNGKLHVMCKGKKKDCVVCSNRRKGGERHETTFYCDTCPDKPRMHLQDCFSRYHTMVKFEK